MFSLMRITTLKYINFHLPIITRNFAAIDLFKNADNPNEKQNSIDFFAQLFGKSIQTTVLYRIL